MFLSNSGAPRRRGEQEFSNATGHPAEETTHLLELEASIPLLQIEAAERVVALARQCPLEWHRERHLKHAVLMQLAEIIKERERKFKEQQERRDNRISSSDVKEALKGMVTVPPDRLLLRWVKYHLRRSTRHG